MSRMTVIVQKCRKSSVKKYDFCVGAQSWKIRHKGEWQGDYQTDLSPECGECHKKWLRHPRSSPLPRQRCCWDVMLRLQLFSSRLLLVTLGEAGVAGELNLEQSSPDRDLQNLTRQQSPAVWGIFFYKENTKHLSQIALLRMLFYFCRVLKLWCWSWILATAQQCHEL